MSYEIPQQLTYQEKIIFGLTGKQLLYVLIFSPVTLILLLKTPFSLNVRISLALIPSSIACVFIFTNMPKQIISMIKWYRKREIKIEEVIKIDEV